MGSIGQANLRVNGNMEHGNMVQRKGERTALKITFAALVEKYGDVMLC